MSLSSDRRNETWMPIPLGSSAIASAIRELSPADWPEFGAMCLFVLAGFSAVLAAVEGLGPAFDYGSILAAGG
jgi:hypothetical protein